MSERTLKHLREVFGREVWALDVDQVAMVLGRTSRGAKQKIRDQMKHGGFPGATKRGNRILLPVEDFAEILEPSHKAPHTPSIPVVSGQASGRTGRRRAAHGPRLTFMRQAMFWEQVCEAMGWDEEVALLDRQIQDARMEGERLANEAVRDRLMALVREATLREPDKPNPI
jgi:hypothetical protein